MDREHVFSEDLWDTYHAAADRIVPADDFPGAWEAGARSFLEQQLGGDLAHLREPVAEALSAIEAAAWRVAQRRFSELDAAEQERILSLLERSDDERERRNVSLLIELTLDGYYANPENGGNLNEVSWKMIGYTRLPGRRPARRGAAE